MTKISKAIELWADFYFLYSASPGAEYYLGYLHGLRYGASVEEQNTITLLIQLAQKTASIEGGEFYGS